MPNLKKITKKYAEIGACIGALCTYAGIILWIVNEMKPSNSNNNKIDIKTDILTHILISLMVLSDEKTCLWMILSSSAGGIAGAVAGGAIGFSTGYALNEYSFYKSNKQPKQQNSENTVGPPRNH